MEIDAIVRIDTLEASFNEEDIYTNIRCLLRPLFFTDERHHFDSN